MKQKILHAVLCLLAAVAVSVVDPAGAAPDRNVDDLLAALDATAIDAKALKTLGYVQNAHGQLDEWSLRLMARMGRGLGPRERDPILDGRADLQVKKIAVTYAGYTDNAALADVLAALATAHGRRLAAVTSMVGNGTDPETFAALNVPIERIRAHLAHWSEQR